VQLLAADDLAMPHWLRCAEIQPTPPQGKGQGPFKMTLQTPADAAAAAESAAELDGRTEADAVHATTGVNVTTSSRAKPSASSSHAYIEPPSDR
jgi:hypothetical protein